MNETHGFCLSWARSLLRRGRPVSQWQASSVLNAKWSEVGGNCASTGEGALHAASEVRKALLVELFNLLFHLWRDDEEKEVWGGAVPYMTKDGWNYCSVVCPHGLVSPARGHLEPHSTQGVVFISHQNGSSRRAGRSSLVSQAAKRVHEKQQGLSKCSFI